MYRTVFVFFGVFFFRKIAVESYHVTITQYNNYHCLGLTYNTSKNKCIRLIYNLGLNTTTDYDNFCITWPNFGYEISGIQIREGSCVKIYKEKWCEGESWIISYPVFEVCDLPDGWEDNVLSVTDCEARHKQLYCPRGSYIRRIVYGDWHEAITIHCYKPTENTPTYSGSTGAKTPSNPQTTSCPVAAHGHAFTITNGWDLSHSPVLKCSRNSSSELINVTQNQDGSIKPKQMLVGSKEDQNVTFVSGEHTGIKSSRNYEQLCDPGQAFTGIGVLVDEGGGIKQWGWMCDSVLDPTEMCEPQEFLGLVLHCDNTESGNELECSYSKTIGVGVSTTITETERQGMTFYKEFGYTVEAGIPGLSASMSASLGFSELVGYEWSRSDTSTWTKETTVQATMKVRPYAHSKLEQLVGKCSFYGTSVNFFKQTDINVTSGEETISYFSM